MKYPEFPYSHPANNFIYCPKCGKAEMSFNEDKRLFCGSCGFTFYINESVATCGILVLPDERIILAKRKFEPRAGTFDLPGGFADKFESAEDCVIREIEEELHLKVQDPVFLASFPNEYVFKDMSYYTCDLAFIFKLNEVPELKPSDDVSDAIFVNPYEIDFETISFPSIVNILKKYIETLKLANGQ
jgi:NAD+ diphosphatase